MHTHIQTHTHTQVRRVPIEDFNGQDLARLVKEGARAVHLMSH